MLSVSDGFKTQLNSDNRQYLYRIGIKLTDNTQLTLTNRHLWSNSLKFSGATSGSGTFDVGAFVAGRLNFIINDIYDEYGDVYDFNLAQVNLEIGMTLANNTTEYLQIGKYVVDSVSYSGMLITLDCLDYAYYFDTAWNTSLSFPTTAGAIVREACTQCGITLATQSWDGINTVIQKKPDDKNLTWRAAIGYAIQLGGQYAKMNPNGQLIVGWYDIDHLNQVTIDGSLLDSHDARILDHIDEAILMSNRNAAQNAWDALSSADKNRYARIRHISRLNVGHYPILITGVRCKVGRGDDAQTYSTGSNEYVIDVSENPFIDSNNANTVITAIGGNTVGFYFYTFDAMYLSMPHYQAGDMCWIEDAQKGRVYCSFITNIEFTAGSYQGSSCGAETPAQKSTAAYTPSMKILAEAGRATRASLDSYEAVAKNMAELISNGMGMYFTKEPQADGSNIYYMHDKPTMSASGTIWKVTSQGFLASTDHGVTWAVDALGNALYNVITARGLNADWINAGTFMVKDSNNNVTFSADKSTGAVVINATSFSLQGSTIQQLARTSVDVGARNLLLDTSDARQSPAATGNTAYVPVYNISDYGKTYLGKSGQVLTLSFDYEVTGNSDEFALLTPYCNGYELTVDANSRYGQYAEINALDEPAGTYRQTFDLSSMQASQSTKKIQLVLETCTNGSKLKVWNVKLEVGDVATDWTAAPEDFAEEISDAISNYDNELDQDKVFDKLTNNGQSQGIYLNQNDGLLYINASYIASGILKLGGTNNGRGRLYLYDASENLVGGMNNDEIYHKSTSNDKVSLKEGGLFFYANTTTEIGSIERSGINQEGITVYGKQYLNLMSNNQLSLYTYSNNTVYEGINMNSSHLNLGFNLSDTYSVSVKNGATEYYVEIPTSIGVNGEVIDYVALRIVGGIVCNRV